MVQLYLNSTTSRIRGGTFNWPLENICLKAFTCTPSRPLTSFDSPGLFIFDENASEASSKLDPYSFFLAIFFVDLDLQIGRLQSRGFVVDVVVFRLFARHFSVQSLERNVER